MDQWIHGSNTSARDNTAWYAGITAAHEGGAVTIIPKRSAPFKNNNGLKRVFNQMTKYALTLYVKNINKWSNMNTQTGIG